MSACACPASVTSRGVFSTRHALDCPSRPAWCAGGPAGRPPHVTDDVKPRKPHMVPLCDACALVAATARKDHR